MRRDRAQAVVPGAAAAGLDPQLARREVDLVMKHHDVGEAELVEMRRLCDGAAGFVHVGAGQQQQHARPIERTLGRDALKPAPPRRDAMPFADCLDRAKADVVPSARIARTGIAEPDEQQHGRTSTASCAGLTRASIFLRRWMDCIETRACRVSHYQAPQVG